MIYIKTAVPLSLFSYTLHPRAGQAEGKHPYTGNGDINFIYFQMSLLALVVLANIASAQRSQSPPPIASANSLENGPAPAQLVFSHS